MATYPSTHFHWTSYSSSPVALLTRRRRPLNLSNPLVLGCRLPSPSVTCEKKIFSPPLPREDDQPGRFSPFLRLPVFSQAGPKSSFPPFATQGPLFTFAVPFGNDSFFPQTPLFPPFPCPLFVTGCSWFLLSSSFPSNSR